MNAVTRTDLRVLAEPHKAPCLSIFLPTSTAEAGPLRLKNLLRRTHQLLDESGWSDEVSESVIRPVRDLLGKPAFCHRHMEGLAVFSAPGFFRYYPVAFHLPELVLAGNQFHLKPLFPAMEAAPAYCLLSLSQNMVQLYRGDSQGLAPVEELELPASPISLQEHHAGHRHPLRWHGSKSDARRKELLLSYFRKVDEVLRTQFRPDHGPIVLAGVTYLCALYRNVSRAGCVLTDEIHGNPDHFSMDELHRLSWTIALAWFQSARDKTADEYYQLWHTTRASNNVREIAAAAHDGRVKSLFLALGEKRDGQNQVADERDLLGKAALDTYMAGGTVFAVRPELVPGRGTAAAVFRY